MGITPLLVAAQRGHIKVVEELLKHGANVNQPNNTGRTPLFVAAHAGHLEVVEKLLDAGADSSKALKDGTTPLQAAMLTKNQRMAQLITKYALKDQSITNTTAAVSSTRLRSNSKTRER